MRAIWVVVAGLMVSSAARAYPPYRRLAMVHYGAPVGCELCHARADSTERSAYGRAWHDKGENESAFGPLEGGDLDGDGTRNVDEIRGGSDPNDRESTPSSPGKYAKRAQVTHIPVEQLQLVAEAVERYDVVEPTLSPAQLAKLEAGLGRTATADERLPTLYLAVRGGKPDEVLVFSHAGAGKLEVSLLLAIGTDGRARRIALYRAGGDDGARFQAYLRCFSGRGKDDIARRAALECAGASAKNATDKQLNAVIAESVRAALWLVFTAFGAS
ncbi:MAG: hypothetical protein ACAI38_25565 [Myxococcota bacterium]